VFGSAYPVKTFYRPHRQNPAKLEEKSAGEAAGGVICRLP